MEISSTRLPSSYRDPSGFVFKQQGVIYRQVNRLYKEQFDHFIDSGCYHHLVKSGLLVSHTTINENITGSADYYLTLQPQTIPFISYPYEWSFDMLKDAALLTLRVAREVIPFGIALKDATPYNIQFLDGKPIFIDTLSFEKYEEKQPWIAYRQFCQSFLAPLVLMHYSRNNMHELQLAFPEGVPLNLTRSLLPWKSRFNLHTYLHIHVQGKMSIKESQPQKQVTFSKTKFLNILKSLDQLIHSLRLDGKSVWSEYYSEASQREGYLEHKKKMIADWAGKIEFRTAIDLGANEGEFSKLLAADGAHVVATDLDPNAVNKLYKYCRDNNLHNIHPLIIDLANPSPAIGVNNEERDSFPERAKSDLAIALAVIHHLVIGKNIPFDMVAKQFSRLCRMLIIEFVPKDDDKIRFMLQQKPDIYTDYTEANFELAFSRYFNVSAKANISGSGRILYLMEKK